MNEITALYIFHNNLRAFEKLKHQYPDLRALWYDGRSSLLKGLLDIFELEVLIIEEDIFDSTQESLSFNLPSNTIVQTGLKQISSNKLANYCIIPSNDTHVFLFQNLLEHFGQYSFLVPAHDHENSGATLEKLGIPYQIIDIKTEAFNEFDCLFIATDWGHKELMAINKFQKSNKPTICLQESVIHFSDHYKRMEWADYPFIQGISTLRYLDREIYFLTGNPRYEFLTPEDPIIDNIAIINCNFTYGIHEEIRATWIEDIVEACQETRFNYQIAQHPRDTGDLSDYNSIRSNASIIHNLIKKSSITITRFSSLIHESLALGRPVVYYNPHNEEMYYDFEPDDKYLVIAKSKNELVEALRRLHSNQRSLDHDTDFYESYIERHCGSADSLASSRIEQAANVIANLDERIGKPSPFPYQFINQNFSKLRNIKNTILNRS